MLLKTTHSVSQSLLDFVSFDYLNEMKTAINQPTGEFFYDPWVIKDEFRHTVFEKILNTLPSNIGEARIIVLESERCYTKHADIDDRYHLNLHGDEGYLIDLESNTMYHSLRDGYWYEMDAGILHTAASFGAHKRIQLVVRKLLNKNILIDPVDVSITLKDKNSRYDFDNVLSAWLNRANKNGSISEFQYRDETIRFNIERNQLIELKNKCSNSFIFKEYE